MAFQLDGSGDDLIRTSNTFDFNSGYTVICHMMHDVSGVTDNLIVISDGTQNNMDEVRINGSNEFSIRVRVGGVGSYGNDAVTISTATWYGVVMQRASVTDLTAYLYNLAGSQLSSPTDTSDVTSRASESQIQIGRRLTVRDWTGRAHNIKEYSAVLTQAEWETELERTLPVRLAGIHEWTPTLPGATERVRGYINGFDWTESGDPADVDPPPISWGIKGSQTAPPAPVTARVKDVMGGIIPWPR